MSRFNYYYETRPLLTMMVTNAILGGIADTCAQTLTSIRERAVFKPGGITEKDTLAIGIHELDLKSPLPRYKAELIPESRRLPPPFEWDRSVDVWTRYLFKRRRELVANRGIWVYRLTRFMAWGFLMAPIQFKWFQLLSRTFPITAGASGSLPALKRVVCDQAVFAPFGNNPWTPNMTSRLGL